MQLLKLKTSALIGYALLFVLNTGVYAQTVVHVKPSSTYGDVYAASGALASVNHSLLTNLSVSRTTTFFVTTVTRSFVHFDVSAIPENAIITKAELRLEFNSGSAFSMVLNELQSSWSESTLTWNNQPSEVSTGALTQTPSSYSENGITYHKFIDLEDFVQNWVSSPSDNHGVRIRRASESSGTSSASYKTKEATWSSASYPVGLVDPSPLLMIEYVMPAEITGVTARHCSSLLSTDGELTAHISGDGPYIYQWYDSAGDSIGTNSPTLGQIPYGWYGLSVRDTLDHSYYSSFLLGVQCDTVTIEYQPDTKFVDDAFLSNYVYIDGSFSIVDEKNLNFGTSQFNTFMAEKYYVFTPVEYNRRALLRFLLHQDPFMSLEEANLTLKGYNHDPGTGSETNASYLNRVTQDWVENLVTFNTAPAINTGLQKSIASLSSNADATVDLLDYFAYWRTDANYGMEINLQDPTSQVPRMLQFFTSDDTIVTNRPRIVFQVVALCGSSPSIVSLDNTLCEGSFATMSIAQPDNVFAIQWQNSSDDDVYTDITGATTSTLITEELTQTTYYRVKLTKDTISVYSPSHLVTLLDSCLTVVDYDTLGLGTISVDISSLGDTLGPYDYVVSPYPLVNKQFMYQVLSLGTFEDMEGNPITPEIDSSFLAGNDAATSKQFTGLAQGSYYNVGVYNNVGRLIYSERKWIGPAITYKAISGMTIAGNNFVPTDSLATITTDHFVAFEQNFEFGLELTTIAGTQTLGIADTSLVFSDYTDMDAGFYIENNLAYIVKSGTLSTESYEVGISSKLQLINDASGLRFLINDVQVDQLTTLPTYPLARLVLGARSDTFEALTFAFRKIIILPILFAANRISVISTQDINCQSGTTGGFTFKFNAGLIQLILSGSDPTYDYQISNLLNPGLGQVTSGTADFGDNVVISGLSPGVYQLSATPNTSPFGSPLIREVVVGYPANWVEVSDYDHDYIATSSNRLTRTPDNLPAPSYAKTLNVLSENETGWYIFEPNATGTTLSLTTETSSIDNIVFTGLQFFSFNFLTGAITSGSIIPLVSINPSLSWNFINHQNLRFYVQFTSSHINYYHTPTTSWNISQPFATRTRPAGDIFIESASTRQGDRVMKSVFSFGCEAIEYAPKDPVTLKEKRDGALYYLYSNKLRFHFDELRDAETSEKLKFEIRNSANTIIASSTHSGSVTGVENAVEHTNNGNYHELDLTGIGLNTSDYYTLIVYTITGKKMYLNFIKQN